MTTPAPKWGLVSDEPTGRLNFGRMGPSSGLRKGSVRTSSSVLRNYRFCPRSESCRSRSSSRRSSSCSSTVIGGGGGAVAVRKRRRAPTGGATSGGSGGLPPTRPAEPHPVGTSPSSCGGGCSGAVRYRTLHLWAAMVRTPTNHRVERSTPIWRGGA